MGRIVGAVLLLLAGLLIGRLMYAPSGGQATGEPKPLAPEAPHPPSRTELIEKIKPSVAVVEMSGVKGKGGGTAFRFEHGDYFVTNFHVLEGSTSGTVQPHGRPAPGCEITRVVAHDRRADWAVVLAPGCGGPALERAPAGSLREGASILIMGNPRGREWTASEGIVSNIISENGGTTALHTAASDNGSSGSPVLDQWGKVVGVHKGRDRETREFRSLAPIDTIPALNPPPDGITMADFAKRYPPEIALERLRQILAEDAVNFSEWIEVAERKNNSGARLPASSRRQYIAEISGTVCRQDSRLPGQVIELLTAEAGFEQSVREEIEIDLERAKFGLTAFSKAQDPESRASTQREAERLFRKFGDQYATTSDTFESISALEREIGTARGRDIVTGRYAQFGEVRRQTAKSLRSSRRGF